MKYKKGLVYVIWAAIVAGLEGIAFAIYNSTIGPNIQTPLAQMSDDAVAGTAGRLVAEGVPMKILGGALALSVVVLLCKACYEFYKVYKTKGETK